MGALEHRSPLRWEPRHLGQARGGRKGVIALIQREGRRAVKADGVPLVARVEVELRIRVVRDEITGEPAPRTEEEAEEVLFARLYYALQGQPKALSLRAPGRRASIGFVLWDEPESFQIRTQVEF